MDIPTIWRCNSQIATLTIGEHPLRQAHSKMKTVPQDQPYARGETNPLLDYLGLTPPTMTNAARAGKQSSSSLLNGPKHGKEETLPGDKPEDNMEQRQYGGETSRETEQDTDRQFLFEKPGDVVPERRTTAIDENSKQDEIVIKAAGGAQDGTGSAVVEQKEVTEPGDGDEHREPTNFSAIPAELRLAIYKRTWEPRRVPIYREWVSPRSFKELRRRSRRQVKQVDDYFGDTDITTVTTSSAQLPVTLWINAESRDETLRHYQISFARSRNGRSHVYFNFDIDELEIPRHCSPLQAIGREELAKIRFLGMPASDVQYPAFLESSTMVKAFSRIANEAPGITPDRVKSILKACRSGRHEEAQKETHKIRDELIQTCKSQESISSLCPSLARLDFQLITTCHCWSCPSPFPSSRSKCATCSAQHRWFADRFARVQVSRSGRDQLTPSYEDVPVVYLDHNDPDTIQEPNSNLVLDKTVVTHFIATPQAACEWPWCLVWSSICGWYGTMMDIRQRFEPGASSGDGAEQLHEI